VFEYLACTSRVFEHQDVVVTDAAKRALEVFASAKVIRRGDDGGRPSARLDVESASSWRPARDIARPTGYRSGGRRRDLVSLGVRRPGGDTVEGDDDRYLVYAADREHGDLRLNDDRGPEGAGARSAEHRKGPHEVSVVRWREATRSSSSLTRRARLEASTRGAGRPYSIPRRQPIERDEIDVRCTTSCSPRTWRSGIRTPRVRERGQTHEISSLMHTSRVERPSASSLGRRTSPRWQRSRRSDWAETHVLSHTRRPLESATTISSVGPSRTARSASRRVIEPPGPLPEMVEGSTPRRQNSTNDRRHHDALTASARADD